MLLSDERVREEFQELLTNSNHEIFALSTHKSTNPGVYQHFPLLWH